MSNITKDSIYQYRRVAFCVEMAGLVSTIAGVSRICSYQPEPITLVNQIFSQTTNFLIAAGGLGVIAFTRMCQNMLTEGLNNLLYQTRQTDDVITGGNPLEQTVQASTETTGVTKQ